MEQQLKITAASSAARRIQIVALSDWQTVDGQSLCVKCAQIPPVDAARILKLNPGERPKLGIESEASPEAQLEQARRILEIAGEVIELGCKLLGPDGAEIPAFDFGGLEAPHELTLNGAQLSERDLMALVIACLQCSGYLGGAAESAFLRSGRGRVDRRDGAREVLPDVRAHAEAGIR